MPLQLATKHETAMLNCSVTEWAHLDGPTA